MRFNHPYYALLLLLLPGLLLLWAWQSRRHLQAWKDFAEEKFHPILAPGTEAWRPKFKAGLKILAMFFLIFALMEPQWGTREEEVKQKGVHVIILADVSASMLAQDVKPSRLERQQHKIRDLIKLLAGDRVGLIAFAGRSFLLSPLTIDYGTLVQYIQELGPETIPVQGTDLAGALQLAMKILPQDEATKAILLFTDGEDHSERLDAMLEEVKKRDIKLFVLGIGTPQGAPVPELGGGFKLDLQGQTIVSKLNEGALKQMALKSGGAYVRTVSSDEDLKKLYLKGIREGLDPTEFKSSRQKVWESRFYWPLGISILILMLERLIQERKKL